MINTKTEMVSVFDERIIEERPWYVPYTEGDPIPQDPTVPHQAVAVEPETEEVAVTETVAVAEEVAVTEAVVVTEEVPVVEEVAVTEEVATEDMAAEEESPDKPKRKNWKDAIAEKAQELSEQAGDQPEASQ